jgi:hypothetical protein
MLQLGAAVTVPLAMPTARRLVMLAATGALVAGAGFCEFRYANEAARVREFCAAIAPGLPLDELKARAAGNGYSWRPPPERSGISFLADNRTAGRFGCRVMLSDGVVKASAFRRPD